MYLTAVRMAFKFGEVDYAMLVKQYGQVEEGVDSAPGPSRSGRSGGPILT